MWVIQGNGGTTSKKQHYYFCEGTSACCVIGYRIAGHGNLAV